MSKLLSHIVQKRFSSVNEDVATDALHFILTSSDEARGGMMKLLRGIEPQLPELHFHTQQSENGSRPDMWGYHANEPRVFIENKFWAGLTDRQPVAYLQQLAHPGQPSVLLVVAPEARRQTLWRELRRRLDEAEVSFHMLSETGLLAAKTERGPTLGLTSWTRLLGFLSQEIAHDPEARSDLLQLQTLCDSADDQAFVPFSAEQITDQTAPALLLQLGQVSEAAVQTAVSRGILDVTGLRPQASWERIGRYARFAGQGSAGFWVGTHLALWRTHGVSPIWMAFANSEFGQGSEVRPTLEAWAARHGLVTQDYNGDFCLALDIAIGEEMDKVAAGVAEELSEIRSALIQSGLIEPLEG